MSAQPITKPAPSVPGAIRFFRGASGLITAAQLLSVLDSPADVADLTERAERSGRNDRAEGSRDSLDNLHGTANADILG